MNQVEVEHVIKSIIKNKRKEIEYFEAIRGIIIGEQDKQGVSTIFTIASFDKNMHGKEVLVNLIEDPTRIEECMKIIEDFKRILKSMVGSEVKSFNFCVGDVESYLKNKNSRAVYGRSVLSCSRGEDLDGGRKFRIEKKGITKGIVYTADLDTYPDDGFLGIVEGFKMYIFSNSFYSDKFDYCWAPWLL